MAFYVCLVSRDSWGCLLMPRPEAVKTARRMIVQRDTALDAATSSLLQFGCPRRGASEFFC